MALENYRKKSIHIFFFFNVGEKINSTIRIDNESDSNVIQCNIYFSFYCLSLGDKSLELSVMRDSEIQLQNVLGGVLAFIVNLKVILTGYKTLCTKNKSKALSSMTFISTKM